MKLDKKNIRLLVILFSIIFLTINFGSLNADSSSCNDILNDTKERSTQSILSHLIFGTATWSDGGIAYAAKVSVMSHYGELTDTVDGQGKWEVDSGYPGPDWPEGTEFTVVISGCCPRFGWYGIVEGVVSGDYNDMGNIIVSPSQDTNNPPNKPYIYGPKTGNIGTSYEYSMVATDPDDDNVYYCIDWGDDSEIYSTGPYLSGEEVKISHTWKKEQTYAVKIQAKDTSGSESDWSTLEVSMPKQKLSTDFNLVFFQNSILKIFPYFKYLFII
jgi:hypothetical protein